MWKEFIEIFALGTGLKNNADLEGTHLERLANKILKSSHKIAEDKDFEHILNVRVSILQAIKDEPEATKEIQDKIEKILNRAKRDMMTRQMWINALMKIAQIEGHESVN